MQSIRHFLNNEERKKGKRTHCQCNVTQLTKVGRSPEPAEGQEPGIRSRVGSGSRSRGGSREQEQGHEYGREQEQEQTKTIGT